MTTLGEALPREMARVTALIELYAKLPSNAGAFAIFMMRKDLADATTALAVGDVATMARIYAELKEYKE